jgi:NAD(P)-dependent dehydrogenase (short-subunit alcohol dehydrogenase family)
MTNPLAVLLGAGPGIGLATALRFHREGFRVALVSRPVDPLPAFREALPGSLVLGVDLALPEGPGEALKAIEAWGGLPRVLVHNASAGTRVPAAELTPEQALEDLRVNVAAALAGAAWALPAMRAAGTGTLLFTGGGLALKPQAGLASASLGKAALRSLALSFAQELEPEGIHAATVTVCGFVQPGSALAPDHVAQAFWELHLQPRGAWDNERVLA